MKLFVAIDLSPITETIIKKVTEIALKTKATIWLVHVVQPDPDFVGYDVGPQTERDFIAKKYQKNHRELQQIAEGMKGKGLKVTPLLLQGPTVETVLSEADKMDADIIITGSHGHGMMYNIFIGSVSKEILNQSTRPVLIIPVRD
ncbi:MAG: universal stress protein [Bacteroidetes bacterium]|nr:universal stress protein [Bacteroidota bacterium]